MHPAIPRPSAAGAAVLLAVFPLLLSPAAVRAQPAAPPACDRLPGAGQLDFWVGEWEVFVGEQRVGSNRIEKVLDGCALLEHWTDARGGEGKSLFYRGPGGEGWRQVWITARAAAPGGVKEKRLVELLEGGAVRFQGEVPLPDGATVLDRTTLTPLEGGEVRQHIEISSDRGTTWRTTFDAVYRPAG